MYEWIGDITGKRLKICRKCALKDLGTKKGRERLKEIDNEWFCAYQKKEISIKDFW